MTRGKKIFVEWSSKITNITRPLLFARDRVSYYAAIQRLQADVFRNPT